MKAIGWLAGRLVCDSKKPSSISALVELFQNKVSWRDMVPEITNLLRDL